MPYKTNQKKSQTAVLTVNKHTLKQKPRRTLHTNKKLNFPGRCNNSELVCVK